tara:strand:- start:2829 stop:5051 length:2223 start_codon:yes stop_codon:yes gene_type:complete
MSSKNKTLVIVESPSKCKKIEQYLGTSYKVIASYGHFTKLDSLDQICFKTYNISYKVDKGKILTNIKKEIKQSKEVILATDDDREGEAIAWCLCKFCGLNPETTKKMVFQEITKSALTNALSQLTTVQMSRVKSQQTRQILDIYLGYKVSPLLWKYVKHTLSAGRCQTPCLKLVYDNQKEIDNLSLETEFQCNTQFTDKRVPFSCSIRINKNDIEDFMKTLTTQPPLWIIETKTSRSIKESPPKVLITSSLQQKAYSYLRFSPKATMKYAQELYENGLITYMRTDNACYSKDFINQLKPFIKTKYGEEYIHPQIDRLTQNKNKQKSQESHEGIRVCDIHLSECTIQTSAAVKSLYSFIYKHTIQCGMSDAHIQETTFRIPFNLYNCYFQHTDKYYTFRGWTILNSTSSQSNTNSYLNYLSMLYDSKSSFCLFYVEANEVLIEQKTHYHEASLVQKLESMGIGRPSTYASILSSILERKYVQKGNIDGICVDVLQYIYTKHQGLEVNKETKNLRQEKQKLSITPLGKQVCEFCYEHFVSIFQYDFTKHMENLLDDIENNKQKQPNVLSHYIKDVDLLIQETNQHYKENPDMIDKVKDKSIHCGTIDGDAWYIKHGKYGYYLCIGKKDKISLDEFKGFSIEQKLRDRETLLPNEIESLESFVKQRATNRNTNMCVELSPNCSIRKSKYGYYVFYKTNKMKKPTFYKYNNEKDENHELRIQWIQESKKQEIISYLVKKYNITI